jgi:signal transduction histidine kinase
VLMLIPPELHPQEDIIVSRLARGERIEHFETVRLRKDHSPVEVSLSVSPIRAAQGEVVGAAKIARDVSEAKRLSKAERELTQQLQDQAAILEQHIEEAVALQEDLERSNAELHEALQLARAARESAEKADRLKGQFMATMSHELRTPLTAIGGYVDLLEMGLRGPITDEQRTDLGRIRRNQLALLRRIEDVLHFSRLESGHVAIEATDVVIDDVLRASEAYVAPMLHAKRLTYRFEGCGERITVHADADKVGQIMANLLANAVKFTEHGHVEVKCAARSDTVEIRVADSGHGIDENSLDEIFEPFVQADSTRTRGSEGTGLGLTISRRLAREMGGDITVRSKVGDGSTFTLVLPRGRR